MAERSLVKTIAAGVAVAVLSPIILHFVLPPDKAASPNVGVEGQKPRQGEALDVVQRRVDLEREQLEILREKVRLTRELPRPLDPEVEPAPRPVARNLSGSYFDQTGVAYSVSHQGDRIQVTQLLLGSPVFVLMGQLSGNRAKLRSPQQNVLMEIYGMNTAFELEIPPEDGVLYVTIPNVMTYRLRRQ